MELVWDCFLCKMGRESKKKKKKEGAIGGGGDCSLPDESTKGRHTHTHAVESKGRLCRDGSRPHYRPRAGLECPIRQPLLLLMGICTVTLTQTRWRDLGTMPRPQCQGLQGTGEMRLSTLIATFFGWVRVPK